MAFRVVADTPENPFCPFCPGNEAATGPPIWTCERDGQWSVRVVPNSYPTLAVERTLDTKACGVYDWRDGLGAHEVIIETPHHDRQLGDLAIDEITAVLKAYRARLSDLRNDVRLQHFTVFKNRGALAGASLEHPHSQLLATPVIPRDVAIELESSAAYYSRKARCLLCDIGQQELHDRRRLVYESDAVVALTPYASRFPFEVWLLPRVHASRFEAADDTLLADTAQTLKDVLMRLRVELSGAPYNLAVHTAPASATESTWHWRIEIIPCLHPRAGGAEVSTGFYVNATAPETAAERLRQVPTPSPRP